MSTVCAYMRKFWLGKTWVKLGQTIQVKAIGKEKFATVSAYSKYIFGVSVNIGGENFGE